MINELLKNVKVKLKQVTPDYEHEARLLVSFFAKISYRELLISDVTPSNKALAELDRAVKKRLTGYPLQYILGEWEFYGLPFFVGEGVLIPRADTEGLVQTCIDFANKRPLKILDLCSGSGCIAVSLAKKLPLCDVYAIEKSSDAISYLRKNVELNKVNVNIIHSDALVRDDSLPNFDVIVSNPPYLTKSDMGNLQREVQFEPPMALYGEKDGLYFYKTLTAVWSEKLNHHGLFAFEVGENQHAAVENIFIQNGYKTICNKYDLCDIIRVIVATK